MPEYPEIYILAQQINAHLTGKVISAIEIKHPKSLNIDPDAFQQALTGASIRNATQRGKWIQVETNQGWLLLNLGMGGELLLVDREHLPQKHRLIFDFSDNACLSVNFWWFGYTHYAPLDHLDSHPMLSKLGPNALELSLPDFSERLSGQRGNIKAFLLDQKNIAGIGNTYVQEMLFNAKIHPLRRIPSLSLAEIEALYHEMENVLRSSIDQGGAFYEVDLFGKKGGFTSDQYRIGYRDGTPCPECGTTIEKIRTGSTVGFVCPTCQPLPG